MSALTICKASAGSGKTFKLTGEYLKLVFNPEINFKNILAVTFTNKATTEMRTRILKAISDIANGRESGYSDELCKLYSMSPDKLKERAQILLKRMLNQYSYFKISTIDSFFQQVIKSIAYELELNSGFTLELDDKSVIDNAISRMIDDFGPESEEGRWILQTIDDKLKDGKRWQIQDEISEFAVKAFDRIDDDKKPIDQIIPEISEFKSKMRKLRDDYLAKINAIGKEAVETMERIGLTSNDFSYKDNGTVWKYFVVCASAQSVAETQYGKRVITQRDDINKMAKDKDVQNRFIHAGLPEMLQQLTETVDSKDFTRAYSADLVLENINKLALAYRVIQIQKEICQEQDLFLLRSAMPFLNKMIGNNDAPFIYEKFGYTLNNFMIDEFQDTSTLNWQNFLPLINNKVAEGHKSLIVGDVKQAIYRWRGGDWKLLDSQVPKEFNITPDEIEKEKLKFNWRSCKNIVKFNNWCFRNISNKVCDYISEQVSAGNYRPENLDIFRRTYSDAEQNIPEKNADTEGFVSFDFLDTTDTDYDTVAAEWLIAQIDRLAELGYQPGDITILVRRKSEGTAVANCLGQAQSSHPELAERYRFVSNEAVLLGNSQAVNLLMSAMQFLLAPTNAQFQAQLVWLYYATCEGTDAAKETIRQIEFGGDASNIWNLMPDEFSAMKDSFRQLDIIQLTNRLIRAFFGMPHQISASDLPFINEFEDRVQAFNDRNGSNLQLFIDWWNEHGTQLAITMNDQQNAIQVMTIHKSKGLEFKAVLLPYLFTSKPQNDKIIWCPTNEEPFNQFSPLPIPYKIETANTIFRDSYFEENFMSHVDNMNLLYVALTRASRDMRICTKKVNQENGAFSFAKVLNMLCGLSQNEDAQKAGIVCGDDRFTIGDEQPYTSDIKQDTNEEKSVPKCLPNPAKISIRCHSEDFFSGPEFDRIERINTGKLYHHIFEYIKYADDVHEAVMKVVGEGYIPVDKAAKYEANISKFVKRQPEWFSPEWNVMTEQPIMIAKDERRPDRILESDSEVVVIDYKFTSRHNSDYNSQVKVYADALRQLTGKKVSGYLWYVWPDEKVEVVS